MYKTLRILLVPCILLSVACKHKKPVTNLILYDGVYRGDHDFVMSTGEISHSYIRFYANGKVQTLSTPSGMKDISKRFNLQDDALIKIVGTFTVVGKNISFTTSAGSPYVAYNGTILDSSLLHLHSKSYITGNETETDYSFIPIVEWK